MSKLDLVKKLTAAHPELGKCWFDLEVLDREVKCNLIEFDHLSERASTLNSKGITAWKSAPNLLSKIRKLQDKISGAQQKHLSLSENLVSALIPVLNAPQGDQFVWILAGLKGQLPDSAFARLTQDSWLARQYFSQP